MSVKVNRHRSNLVTMQEEAEQYLLKMEEDIEEVSSEDDDEETTAQLEQLQGAKLSLQRVTESLAEAIEHLGGA